eukprot:GEMP01039121.1.p1 GENE.GEMP01039121.1~~GEMP01039121.1.p1  ORF type:complete len:172 (+),score=35.44 GEMP01039121.1:37-552(+)
MAAEASWDTILQDWLINPKTCSAVALASRSDFIMYAAAPTENEAGWNMVYAADREEMIMQDDGSEKAIFINEAATLKDACERDLQKDGPPKTGLWLGGEKYKLVQMDRTLESTAGSSFVWMLASRPKKGVHIICTAVTVIVCFYDESLGQTTGNCKNAAVEMADFLVTQNL